MCYEPEPVHTEDYKGHTINIVQDQSGYCRNPYEDGDYMMPMMVKGGRDYGNHDYYEASKALYPTTGQYRRHKKALLEVFNIDPNQTWNNWGRVEKLSASDVEYELHEAIGYAIKEHDYDKLEAVAKILGIPHLNTCTSGYCQGDYLDLLVIATPDWIKKMGLTKKKVTHDMMKDNAEVYGAWAWGDVYGYTIEGPHCDDSCWGYLEPDIYHKEKTAVLQEARAAVDAAIERHQRKEAQRIAEEVRKHTKALKGYIVNKTPFIYRQPLSL